jgi:hypothetical protein
VRLAGNCGARCGKGTPNSVVKVSLHGWMARFRLQARRECSPLARLHAGQTSVRRHRLLIMEFKEETCPVSR